MSLQCSVELWSGNVSDKNRALQLLWIVDIVKFWAEYTYKPMIGACLARLKAQVDKHDEVPLEETLWKSHIPLNKEKTPWFFHLANLPHHDRNQPHNSSSSGDSRPKLKFKSLSDQCSPLSPETAPNQILHRRPTFNAQLINAFTWLQDSDPGHGDLLIIRIGREGEIDKPLVLLDSTTNNNSAQYSAKVLSHAGVDVGLIKGKRGVYLLRNHPDFFSSNHQFCAILPLEPKADQDQRQKSNKSSIFEPLEKLFDLDGLYRIYDQASDEEHNAESYQGSDNNDTSDDEADTSSDDDVSGDYEEEEEEEEEEMEHEVNIDDNVEPTTDDYELDIPQKQCFENLHNTWERHEWPDEKREIHQTFARVAIRLDLARQEAYNVKDGNMYSQGDELPIDWMTPVKLFGKSFSLVGSADEGKKAVRELGCNFKSFGIK